MGVPQVWAQTDTDMLFGLGWLHATERLFQMELARRLAAGTLAEVFGPEAFEIDRRQRQIGFRRIAEQTIPDLDAASRALLDAYVAGVNARIAGARLLPPEFVVLRFRPQPWTTLDVVTLFAYQSWFPTELAERGRTHARLMELLGPVAAELLARIPEEAPPSAPNTGLAWLLGSEAYPMRMAVATNNWVLAPARSLSERALHAADPHLAIHMVPDFWYLAGLHSEASGGAVGITVAGLPVMPMGHNGRVAWSFSVAPLVLTDYFRESFHPTDTLLARTPDGYARLDVRFEEIAVRGEGEPRRVPVYRTPRGVLLERDGATGLSMHWSGYDLFGAGAVAAGLRFQAAHDFDTFQQTIGHLGSLSVNWIYSDRAGNIAYQLGPLIPDRTYNPFEVQDAADPDARHRGYHPPHLRPMALNPARGWLATTNNPPAPPDWPVDIPGNYNFLRMHRVKAWMDTAERFSRAEMEQMQLDFVSAQALQWRELLAQAAEKLGRPELAGRLRTWNGSLAADDTLATTFVFWWHTVTRHLFEDNLGDEWRLGAILREIVLLENHEDLIDDRRTAQRETAVEIASRALWDALERANDRPLGEVQTLTIRHPLARSALLERWLRLNRGPFPRGGDQESLNLTGATLLPAEQRFEAWHGPSMRFVLDWADIDGFTIEIPTGQSGNPFSRHYDDFLRLNQRGERWVVPFSRAAVEERAVRRLRLVPPAR